MANYKLSILIPFRNHTHGKKKLIWFHQKFILKLIDSIYGLLNSDLQNKWGSFFYANINSYYIYHIFMLELINFWESSTKYMIVWDGGLLNWWHELNIMRISYLNHQWWKLSPYLFKISLPPLQAPTYSH